MTLDLATVPPGEGDRVVETLGTLDSEQLDKIKRIRQEQRIRKQGKTVPLSV